MEWEDGGGETETESDYEAGAEAATGPVEGESQQQLAAISISQPPAPAPGPSLESTLGGGATLSTAIQPVPRPQPTPIPSHAALCMWGKLAREGASHVCRGVWAMKRDDHFDGREEPFEFSITPPATVPLPADGQYDGLFYMVTKRGTKYEDSSNLAFTPNSCGGWNIKGRGQNVFGTYRVSGTVTADMKLELFRFFNQDRRGQPPPPQVYQLPRPIVTAPAPAPFPRAPTFTSSATAGAGAGSSSFDDRTTGDDEQKVGWGGA
jgi:hypothetical protein